VRINPKIGGITKYQTPSTKKISNLKSQKPKHWSYFHSSWRRRQARMKNYPENRLTTIPAEDPLKAGGIQSPSLVSPFGKGGLRGISLHSWMPDQVWDGEKEYLDAGSGPAWDRWLRRLR
jgi:hypothetical protein